MTPRKWPTLTRGSVHSLKASKRAGIGFTMVELLVCVALIGSGILFTLALFTGLIRSSQKSADRATGALMANTILTREINQILAGTHPTITTASFFSNDSPPQPPIQGTVVVNNTIYTYEIGYQTMTDSGGTPMGTTSGLTTNRTKRVNITVWWWVQNANEQREGYGYLRTHLTRLVNESTET